MEHKKLGFHRESAVHKRKGRVRMLMQVYLQKVHVYTGMSSSEEIYFRDQSAAGLLARAV